MLEGIYHQLHLFSKKFHFSVFTENIIYGYKPHQEEVHKLQQQLSEIFRRSSQFTFGNKWVFQNKNLYHIMEAMLPKHKRDRPHYISSLSQVFYKRKYGRNNTQEIYISMLRLMYKRNLCYIYDGFSVTSSTESSTTIMRICSVLY